MGRNDPANHFQACDWLVATNLVLSFWASQHLGLLNQFLVTGVFTFIEPENSEDLVNDETPKQSFYEKFIQFHEKFDSDVRQFVGGSGTQEKTQHCEFCDQSFTRARQP